MASIERERFEVEGQDLGAWRLTGPSGIELRAAPLGAAILSLAVPDRTGRSADVVLGYERPDAYIRNPSYLGVVAGRCANRIAGASFRIGGVEHRLSANDGPNHLHGGAHGFSHALWAARPVQGEAGPAIVFEHISPDGDQGYPGALQVRATYALTDRNELVVDYEATTDRPTHVTLTQHSYFNLAGHDAGDAGDHVLEVFADRFLPVDRGLIPTGELRSVAGTPFDFRRAMRIGARIEEDDEQLRIGRGYDHCFVLRRAAPGELVPAARVVDPGSGRTLEVFTTEPGMQLYSGNYLGDEFAGKGGAHYRPRSGFALETQHFPDSPNRPGFPSTLLRPGATYRSRTVYRFSVTEAGAG